MSKCVPICLRAAVLYLLVLTRLALPGRAQHATATIHFDQPTGPVIGQGAFGLNLFQGFDPGQSGTPGNAAYKAAMAFMNPGIVRYHSWEMLGPSTNRNGWLTADNRWDAAKIKNALDGAPAYPQVLMNIPGWPAAWQDAENRLLPSRYAEYADWCADLLRIINVDQGRGIKYWEITNERDDVYKENSDELGRIFTQVAAAMKAVDPTIKTGGAAFARPDLFAQVNAFFSTAAPALDFVSYHSYANGTPNAPTQQVYDRAVAGGLISADMRREFAKHSGREVEFFHNEFNISWNPPDPHQSTYVSMLFDAILTLTAVKSGATGTMAWNECDGWYGKMDNSYNKRPAAYLYHNFNAHLPGGTVCNATVSNGAALVVLATQQGSLRKLVVVNRSDADQRYAFTFTGLPGTVDNSTLFAVSQNLPQGGIATKDLSYGQLTAAGGALFGKNTVTILSIDLDNLRSTGDLEAPAAPTDLAARATDRTLTLSWTAATDNVGVTGYDVYRDGVPAGSTDAATTQFASAWLEPSTAYAFAVVARDGTGNASAPASLTATTTAYAARPVASVFTPTSWNNPFAGNVTGDDGQTTTAGGGVQLAQDEELRIRLAGAAQYTNVYGATFANPIDLSIQSELKVNIRSDAALALRVKLFDAAGNQVDFWQNTFYLSGDNQSKTYALDFAANGFGSVDRTRVKGLVLMYADAPPASGTLYLDNLALGTPNAYAGLRNPDKFINTAAGLDYAYYEGAWNLLPDFNALTPAETGTVANFDLSPKNRTDNYAFRYTGYVQVPADGRYTFYTSSDDGSKLYIGDQEVVNNDGLHGMVEKSGTIALKAGLHAITVSFFEQGGGEGLEVRYAGPNLGKQLVPDAALFRLSPVVVSGFSPASGRTGTPVVITGSGLTGATAVTFGGVAAESFAVDNPGQLTAVVPYGATTGKVQVTTPDGTAASPGDFTVLPNAVTTAPVAGSPFCAGTDLEITFSTAGLFAAGNVFTAQLSDAAGSFANPTPLGTGTREGTIPATLPASLASGTGYRVRVVSSAPGAEYRDNGADLTINALQTFYADRDGDGYGNAAAATRACTAPTGYVAAAGDCNDANPAVRPGAAEICGNGVDDNCNGQADEACPAISGFSPAAGPAGTFVTINGPFLAGATAVTFNGTPAASYAVNAAGQVTAVVPAGATSGAIRVTVPNGTAVSSTAFTVQRTYPKPVVAGFSPGSGPVGTAVTVTGSGFYAGVTAVQFNGKAAVAEVLSGTSLRAVVPAGAGSGRVSVQTPGGTATSKNRFTVTVPAARAGETGDAAPVRFRVSPNPFAGAPTLRWEGPLTGPVSVVVFDGYGRAVFRTQALPATGILPLDRGLPAGLYYLQIRHGQAVQTVKAVKR